LDDCPLNCYTRRFGLKADKKSTGPLLAHATMASTNIILILARDLDCHLSAQAITDHWFRVRHSTSILCSKRSTDLRMASLQKLNRTIKIHAMIGIGTIAICCSNAAPSATEQLAYIARVSWADWASTSSVFSR
jgi:hypothetical protein